MSFLAPKIPALPATPLPPPAAHPATLGSSAVQGAGVDSKATAAMAEGKGFDNTIFTSAQGDMTPVSGAKATLLGQTSGG